MKAILAIDLPDDFLADPSNAYRLKIGGDAKVYYVREGEKRGSIIGDIRNIKPMPKKLEPPTEYEWNSGEEYMWGWNHCLEELEK